MIKTKPKVVPIDHGWMTMKTEQDVFTSGVSEITTEPALFNDVLEYNNKYYKIGGKRLEVKEDKVHDDITYPFLCFPCGGADCPSGSASFLRGIFQGLANKNMYAKIIFAKILLIKEKMMLIYCFIHNYKNIFAKIIFAKILLNLEKKCDSIFLKGGNGEWKNYQH